MAMITGVEAAERFRYGVLLIAIKMYLKTGMKYTRTYTPKNMMLVVGQLTGKTYKRTELRQAGQDLAEILGKSFDA